MRNVVLYAMGVVATSFAFLHCAGAPATSGSPSKNNDDVTERPADGGRPSTTPAGYDAAAPDAAPRDAGLDARPDVDAARPPPPPPPPLACTQLASCCVQLTDSYQAGACLATVAYGQIFESPIAQIAACAAGYALYDCAAAGIQTQLGPSCSQLVACCNSSAYGPYIGRDPACTSDWRQENETICDQDLAYYQGDDYGDCL